MSTTCRWYTSVASEDSDSGVRQTWVEITVQLLDKAFNLVVPQSLPFLHV